MKILLISIIVALASICGTYLYLSHEFQLQRIYDKSLDSAIQITAYINILSVLKQGDLQKSIGSVEGLLSVQADIARICVVEDCGRSPNPAIIEALKKESAYEYDVYAP